MARSRRSARDSSKRAHARLHRTAGAAAGARTAGVPAGLAPMTNDFVALLKDSSLVSVLTVVELTKQTPIFATNHRQLGGPRALCAALYLAMSLPLAHWRAGSKRRWRR